MKTTFEITSELIQTGNKKALFDTIYLNASSEVGSTLIGFEKDCSSSFCQDIAKRAYESYISDSQIRMSEKQAWCLVFDIIKISHMYDAWSERELKSIEKINN